MILADIRLTYRSPAFYGEALTIETRVPRIGRSSFTMEHRLTAPASRYGEARLVAVADVGARDLRLRGRTADPAPA